MVGRQKGESRIVIIPTSEEVYNAYLEIDANGPGHADTVALGVLTIRDPILRRFIQELVERMATVQLSAAERPLLMRGALTGALMAGLNYGLRIGEARSAHGATSTGEGSCEKRQ